MILFPMSRLTLSTMKDTSSIHSYIKIALFLVNPCHTVQQSLVPPDIHARRPKQLLRAKRDRREVMLLHHLPQAGGLGITAVNN